MSDENKYINIALKFIENNNKNLGQIYLEHYKTNGHGVIVINLSDVDLQSNINVSFVPMNILDADIVEKINDRKLYNNEDIIYFFLITPNEEKILEIDIKTLC